MKYRWNGSLAGRLTCAELTTAIGRVAKPTLGRDFWTVTGSSFVHDGIKYSDFKPAEFTDLAELIDDINTSRINLHFQISGNDEYKTKHSVIYISHNKQQSEIRVEGPLIEFIKLSRSIFQARGFEDRYVR